MHATTFPRPQPLPDDLAEPIARAADRLGPFAGQIVWYAEVPSTNDVAASLAERGAPEGIVVAANAQTAGRGRHGRRWASPPGAGLYFSTVVRPVREAVPTLTIAAGVAVAEGIQAATGLSLDLKWPNDVYLRGRKVAGVLAEASTNAPGMNVGGDLQVGPATAVQYVVLGFGINVMPAAYAADVAARAASLEGELGRPVDRGLLLAECLSSLAAWYTDLQNGPAGVIDAWRARARSTLGCRVRWNVDGTVCEGVAENIDERGALVVRTRSGPVTVISGEVLWL